MSLLEYRLASLVLRACYLLCSLLPIRSDTVVLASARSDVLEGNLRFVNDAIRRERPDLRVVLALDRYSYDLAGKLGYLLALIRGSYLLATSRFFVVDNAYLPVHIGPHRRGTTVIQVWHAAGALKCFGLDIRPPNRSVEGRFLHRFYDYVIVGSGAAVAPYASALRTDASRVLPLGVPRTDFFFDEGAMAAARERFFTAYPALRGQRIVLYAPTFRGHGEAKAPAQRLDAAALRRRLGEGWALVHKTHPVFASETVSSEGYDAVISTAFDINELFCVTDVLVTDYSSSVFEYALLRKPLVLLIDDLESYERDPGFYLDFRSEMIGEVAATTEEVGTLIGRGAWDLDAWDAFLERHCSCDDGHASSRFVEFLGSM